MGRGEVRMMGIANATPCLPLSCTTLTLFSGERAVAVTHCATNTPAYPSAESLKLDGQQWRPEVWQSGRCEVGKPAGPGFPHVIPHVASRLLAEPRRRCQHGNVEHDRAFIIIISTPLHRPQHSTTHPHHGARYAMTPTTRYRPSLMRKRSSHRREQQRAGEEDET